LREDGGDPENEPGEDEKDGHGDAKEIAKTSIGMLAHDLGEKEFKQTMTAHEFGRHPLACLGQFHAMIGGIAHLTAFTQPLEELCDARIAELPRRLKGLQAFPYGRGGNGLATFAQLTTQLQAVNDANG